MTPGMAKDKTKSRLTLPNLKWEIPERRVVKISAMCTEALATTG
jgi:hypothetical protein